MTIPKAKKLPSGNWRVRVQVDGKIISITKPTKKEAEKEAIRIKLGDTDVNRFVSLRDAVNKYIDSKRPTRSPSTIRGYVCISKHRFQDLMMRDVYDLALPELNAAIGREAQEVAPKTLKNAWAFIASCIKAETGKTFNVDLPQVVVHERKWLTPVQIPIFVSAIKGKSFEIPALLALSSLRCSELLDLEWNDIDLDKGVLRVTGSAVPDEHGVIVHKRETKNLSSRRVVPIIKPLEDALRKVKYRQQYVVTLKEDAIYKRINKVCRENGLPEVGIHGLRHSFASLAYSLDMPEKVAMKIGGWSDDRTMRKIYTHIEEEKIAEASEAFTGFFQN